MRFSEEFLADIKARVRLSDVVGRKVKLKKQGRDWVGLSPFSNEKTPSFHVHDDKGFYKCFSTQASGDVLRFLMETEKLTFAEAVEKLAGIAGVPMPQATPEGERQARRQAGLADWVEAATQWFETQLRGSAGAEARAYLERRGFGPDAWARHRLGFAPDGWRNLADALTARGATPAMLLEAGLLATSEDGAKQPYDRFRNRVMFPIADAAGRIVAFGARTLEPDGKPKYLNSPETPLFHKSSVLYRYRQAREALASLRGTDKLSRGLVVTEGYVDAIALTEAGVATAVAPLGTALTEEQIGLLWRAGPEPILCFDGDAAGIGAAHKAIDRALPLIEPNRTLYFVTLPQGLDPDDVIRLHGAEAMRSRLLEARPLVDLLWKRELDREPLDTPERQAGLQSRLAECAAKIKHAGVRKAYERELQNRCYQHFRAMRAASDARRQPRGSIHGRGFAPGAGSGVNYNPRPPGTLDAWAFREFTSPGASRQGGLGLLVRAIETPGLLEAAREDLTRADFLDPDLSAIRDAALSVLDDREKLDRRTVAAHLRILGRTRSEKLLEEYPATEALDLSSEVGALWYTALKQFPATTAVNDEARSVVQEVAEKDGMSRSDLRRLSAMVGERSRLRRMNQEDGASGDESGTSRVGAELETLGTAVKHKFPGG